MIAFKLRKYINNDDVRKQHVTLAQSYIVLIQYSVVLFVMGQVISSISHFLLAFFDNFTVV